MKNHKSVRIVIYFALFLFSTFLVGCTKEVEDYETSMKMNGEVVKGLYTGLMKSEKASGEGSFIVAIDDTTNWVYEGSFKDNVFSGKGVLKNYPMTITYDGKEITGLYNGATVDGAITGEGTFEDNMDDLTFSYKGSFKDSSLSGKGQLTYDKLVVHFEEKDREGSFEGETLDGVPCGNGKFTAVNDDNEEYTYTGEWNDGLWDGEGEKVSDSGSNIGHFEKGNYKPNKSDLLKSLGTIKEIKYDVPDSAVNFVKEHDDFFVTQDTTALDQFVDSSLNYTVMSKTPDKFGDKLIKLEGYHVDDIVEIEILDDDTFNIIVLTDNQYSHYYLMYYLGSSEGIYTGAKVTAYGLPINLVSLDIGGIPITAYVLYGCNIH